MHTYYSMKRCTEVRRRQKEYSNEVAVIAFAVNSGKWEAINQCNSIAEICAIFVEFLQGIKQSPMTAQLKTYINNLEQLGNRSLLGYLTSIADFVETLTNSVKD